MADIDSDYSGFSDNMALVASMKDHTCSQGWGATDAVVAGVLIKKFTPQRTVRGAAVFAMRMDVILKYDLSTPAGMDKFAQEIILQRTPAHMNADFTAMPAGDARDVLNADTEKLELR